MRIQASSDVAGAAKGVGSAPLASTRPGGAR
jgi:hypothetical protein